MEVAEIELRVVAINDRKRLVHDEEQMKKAAYLVAENLRNIHNKKLYRHDYPTFEAYCDERWGISRARAYQIIQAQEVRLMLADAVKDDPVASGALQNMSERAVRELGQRSDPIKVLKAVSVKTSKPKIRDVQKKKDIEVCPTCGRKI